MAALRNAGHETIAPDSKFWLQPGDIVIQRANSLEYVGTTALFNGPPNTYIYPDLMMRVRAGTAVDPSYLCTFLNAPNTRKMLRSKATGTAGNMPKVNGDTVRSTLIDLPPLAEQRRIVAKLDDLLARSRRARAALDAIPPLLDKLRQAILAAAFRGDLTADWRAKHPDVEPAEKLLARIRVERRRAWEAAELAKLKAKGKAPTDDRWKAKYEEPEAVDTSELPELPQGWCWAAWREVGFSQNGRPFPSSKYQDNGFKLLRPGNLHVNGRLDWSSNNTRFLPDDYAISNHDAIVGENELVINLTAQSLKDDFLGRICLSGKGEKCLLNQRIARLSPIALSAPFVLWLFKSPLVRGYIDELNTGSIIQHMFTSQIENFAIPIPPTDEQHELVELVGTAMDRLDLLRQLREQAADQLPTLEAGTLAKAFRGELVPQDPNDEPASVLLERIRAERAQAANGKSGGKRGSKVAEENGHAAQTSLALGEGPAPKRAKKKSLFYVLSPMPHRIGQPSFLRQRSETYLRQ